MKTLFHKPALGVTPNLTQGGPEAPGAKAPMASNVPAHSLTAIIPEAGSGVRYIFSEVYVLKLPPFPDVEILSTNVCDRGILLHPVGY